MHISVEMLKRFYLHSIESGKVWIQYADTWFSWTFIFNKHLSNVGTQAVIHLT